MATNEREIMRPVKYNLVKKLVGRLEMLATNGTVILMSPEDEDLARSRTWGVQTDRKTGYSAVRHVKRHYPSGKCTITLLHRAIAGADKDQFVDHINQNTMDNRRCNLRFATKQQNAQNNACEGLSLRGHRYRARITVGGKTITIGNFDSREEALAARKIAISHYFGEFARKG